MKTFLAEVHEEYPQLKDVKWLLDVCSLTDVTAKLNDLNWELPRQGKKYNVCCHVHVDHIIQKCNLKHFTQVPRTGNLSSLVRE
jgi:hypothetical protein